MGLVVRVKLSWDYECTFFVQSLDKKEAKEKSFKMFKQLTGQLSLTDTLEEAEQVDCFSIEIIAEIEHILL